MARNLPAHRTPGLAQDQPVAKSPGRDEEAADRKARDELREDDRARRDDVGAASAYARKLPAEFQWGRAEFLFDGQHPLLAQEVILDPGGVVLGEPHVERPERGHGSPDADGPFHGSSPKIGQPLGKGLPDQVSDGLEFFYFGGVVAESLLIGTT